MAQLSKATFKHFVETECERRLVWDLGGADPSWLDPLRESAELDFARGEPARLGHSWEQRVYQPTAEARGPRLSGRG
ncbi:MAG: hypothetical protein HY909_07155 [Deltaproteobacteria bacterium]|nr:hypothetical protein [Deltaproteobacteria bacterium]